MVHLLVRLSEEVGPRKNGVRVPLGHVQTEIDLTRENDLRDANNDPNRVRNTQVTTYRRSVKVILGDLTNDDMATNAMVFSWRLDKEDSDEGETRYFEFWLIMIKFWWKGEMMLQSFALSIYTD